MNELGIAPDGPERLRLRVLLVEDQPLDAELILIRLDEEGFDADWTRVDTAADYLAALRAGPDLILSDWNLPGFGGDQALDLLHEAGLDIPFIIVSGSVGEERAITAIRSGADDYILKDRIARLGSSIRRSLALKVQREDKRQSDIELRQAATIFASTAEGILLTDAEGTVLTVNPAFTAITGFPAHEVIGWNIRRLSSDRHDADFFAGIWTTLTTLGTWRGEVWNRRRSGEPYPQWLTLSSVFDRDGTVTNFVGTFSDVSAIKEAQEAADFLTHHDPLTGLPNRQLFRNRLAEELRRGGNEPTEGDRIAVLHLDLDRFKQINDSLGHPRGDTVLQQLARRISEAVGSTDLVARLGGDDFGVLSSTASTPEDVASLARRLLDATSATLRVDGHELSPTVSVGLSLAPSDGTDADLLLQNAERAMYEAKAYGRNTYQFFAPHLNAGIAERLELEHALRGAADRGELRLHYQPQVDIEARSLSGVEALVRWEHPRRGLIPPGTFIPLAEEMGIVADIGQWVLDESCRQIIRWEQQDFEVPRIAVNLSVQELERPDLVSNLSSTLTRHGISADRIEVEVTESMMIRQPERSLRALDGLRSLGVGLAMDDFGTGYSSLSQLKRMPLTALKIDMSFVSDIGRDTGGEAIVELIIALARSMGIETIAEGIETRGQLSFLHRAGCSTGQGYLFARPLTGAALFSSWGGTV